jgi:hypothetical protein
MFVVTEADAAAIRAAFDHGGEFAAAIELRQRFPGITDNAQARECALTIATWKPLPLRSVKRRCRGHVGRADAESRSAARSVSDTSSPVGSFGSDIQLFPWTYI